MSWIHKTRVTGVRGPLGYRPTNKEDTRGLANFFLCASTDKEKGVEGFGVKDSKLLLQKKFKGCVSEGGKKRCFCRFSYSAHFKKKNCLFSSRTTHFKW